MGEEHGVMDGGGGGGRDGRERGGSRVGATRAVDVYLVGLAPNAHLQVFEASSVAYALQAISSLEFDWHGMVPGVARQLKGIARGEFGFLFCVVWHWQWHSGTA